MKIFLNRGLDQVGGCITEIRTETSRIFIDIGQNLPGVGEETTSEQDRDMVETLFANNKKEHEAVFYTHAHEDHVGLCSYVPANIPQYISEGSKDILLVKYKLAKKSDKRRLEEAYSIFEDPKSEKDIEYVERIKESVEKDECMIRCLESSITWQRAGNKSRPKTIEIGDIRVTPFFNCHSIYDSSMFLIEAEGKRIWHTGDYRKHGYMGKGLVPTLKRYATNIDLLITEGTMLDSEEVSIHESEVSRKMACVMDAFKYVVVLTSATDIERLAATKEAARKVNKQIYVCSSLMKNTMEIFTRNEAEKSKGLFEFHPRFIGKTNSWKRSMLKNGFVLITGAGNLDFIEEFLEDFDPREVLLIYSTWDGYYKDAEQIKLNPNYALFRESFYNVVDIHTSGHADRKTIAEVINTINPKKVVCIHKEKDQSLRSLNLSEDMNQRIINKKIIEL